MRTILVASLLVAVTSMAASGAALRSVEGGVSVNTGNGYTHAATSQNVTVGSRIQTALNGSAEIVYPNGCIRRISPNQTVTVQRTVNCNNWASSISYNSHEDAADDSRNNLLYVLGGAAIVGGAAAIIIPNSGSNSPASP